MLNKKIAIVPKFIIAEYIWFSGVSAPWLRGIAQVACNWDESPVGRPRSQHFFSRSQHGREREAGTGNSKFTRSGSQDAGIDKVGKQAPKPGALKKPGPGLPVLTLALESKNSIF